MRIIIFAFLVFIFSSAFAENETRQVCINNACVNAKIADNDSDRQRGLMFRESLPEDQGMLFVFQSEDKYGFWMKNMLIPLDIIWISKGKRVVDISQDAKPCDGPCNDLIPKEKIKYVLEVNSGFANKHKIKIGDKINFNID